MAFMICTGDLDNWEGHLAMGLGGSSTVRIPNSRVMQKTEDNLRFREPKING